MYSKVKQNNNNIELTGEINSFSHQTRLYIYYKLTRLYLRAVAAIESTSVISRIWLAYDNDLFDLVSIAHVWGMSLVYRSW